jgi:two-component system cell cycle response regulator
MSKEKQITKILLVEDNLADALLFRTMLGSDDFKIISAASLEEAIALTQGYEYDVALLNLSLPDSEGLDTLSELIRHAPKLPIVALTGIDDAKTGPLAIRIGAQDFLAKTDATRSLLRLPDVIHNAIERKRVLDILSVPENRNSLTGLMNTGAIIDWIAHLMNRKGDPPSFAVIAVELTNLSWVSKELGDESANISLMALSQRLSKHVRGYDMPAQINDKELVVVLGRIRDPQDLPSITERLNTAMNATLELDSLQFSIDAYSAAIYCTQRTTDPQELLEVVCRAGREAMATRSHSINVYDASSIKPWKSDDTTHD